MIRVRKLTEPLASAETRRRIQIASFVLLAAGAVRSDGAAAQAMPGFPGEAARTQTRMEERFAAGLSRENLREWLREFSGHPHHAGSAGGRRVAESLAAKFTSWGFGVEIETYYALMPTPKELRVEMLGPSPYQATPSEPVIPGRTPADAEGSLAPYNAYSRDGEVTASAVYANYGMPADFDVLARHRVDVKGKILVIRYGGIFRGIVTRLAGEKGAVGVIFFSDPADLGYARGATYPEGALLPADGCQRGSVLDVVRIPGDPLAPGRAIRRPPSGFSMAKVAREISPVPVLPLSAEQVRPILAQMQGPVAPPGWRGALPLTYRLGGNVKLRMNVSHHWNIVPLYNVVAKLAGSTWPDEWVLRGNHHDAWNYGALDSMSGLVAMMEEARNIAALTKTGWRPRRTLVYLAWDGHELGLTGNTQWADAHEVELSEKSVAYLNTGPTTQGFFSASGSHVLAGLVDQVARVVKDPRLDVPVFDRVAASVRAKGSPAPERFPLRAPGIATDAVPFLNHLGISSLDYEFGGEADQGVFHSIYDNSDYFDRFGDPGYRYSVRLAEAAGRTVLRLADAEILPFDFTGMAMAISGYVNDLIAAVEKTRTETRRENANIRDGIYALADDPARHLAPRRAKDEVPAIDFAELTRASERLTASAAQFSAARDALESSEKRIMPADLERLNRKQRQAERLLLSRDGLPGRPWYRHQVYAPGMLTGYAPSTLPALREAVEGLDWKAAQARSGGVAAVIEAYARNVDEATEIVRTGATAGTVNVE